MCSTHSLSKRGRVIAALSVLFFIVYCSAGVCTNLIGSVPPPVNSAIDHSQHNMDDQAVEHCSKAVSACEWGTNAVADTLDDFVQSSLFFFLYISGLSVLLLRAGLHLNNRQRPVFSFARAQYYQQDYPRIHLQKAVFLN